MQRLADLAHIHRTTLLCAPESEKLQDYMRDSVSVIVMLLDSAGAMLSMRSTGSATCRTELGGKTAEYYVANGKAEAIRLYVTNLSAGATGYPIWVKFHTYSAQTVTPLSGQLMVAPQKVTTK
ncbi:hypothetical protein [Pseudoxanthomonas sp. UTMC 1351]|uniref:hypothetical protein n=1 Tax=Pseudoxanthomonas sp. UTMC 1351 TaxID=2695853 RepID=UPI0034CEA538